MTGAAQQTVHASCVAFRDRAILIFGRSGSGKSGLALELVSRGCALVADDRTILAKTDDCLVASAPETIDGLIEARGIGILQLPTVSRVPVAAAVNMDIVEKDRLPSLRHIDLLGVSVPCLHKPETAHFPAAIMVYLMGIRKDPS